VKHLLVQILVAVADIQIGNEVTLLEKINRVVGAKDLSFALTMI